MVGRIIKWALMTAGVLFLAIIGLALMVGRESTGVRPTPNAQQTTETQQAPAPAAANAHGVPRRCAPYKRRWR